MLATPFITLAALPPGNLRARKSRTGGQHQCYEQGQEWNVCVGASDRIATAMVSYDVGGLHTAAAAASAHTQWACDIAAAVRQAQSIASEKCSFNCQDGAYAQGRIHTARCISMHLA